MSDYFPLEVIVEILQRLPVKSLVKFICVCKVWKSIITNDAFIRYHHQHLQSNPSNSSLFFHLQRYDDHFYIEKKGYFYSLCRDDDATDIHSVFKFPPVYTSSHASDTWAVYGTCNGLVCFADYSPSDSGQAFIWNPSILKLLILPKSSLTLKIQRYYVYYGFGFDSQNHDLKVVRFVSPGCNETSSQVEIYSLAAHSWRSITVAPLPFRVAGIENKFINGVLHWLAYRKMSGRKHYFILTFDIVEEKMGELMLPKCLEFRMSQDGNVESHDAISFLRGGNLLALEHMCLNFCFDSRSVWVMKEYGVVESWTKLFHFDSTSFRDISKVLAFRNIEEVVIISPNNEIAFLDPTKGLVKTYKSGHNRSDFISFVGDHVESLFLINENNAKTYLPL